ncbi:hypothetical protein MYCTH_2057586 [Thermothelomyces thermophilus ATCC 42464]|uniref:Uncharacterized protein n=1 Tax=Thermothelomyces thermophilus (strain ATCC 42464 / BCRC 31852 / DSM 1799) TaxID=573729 RepID=G2Q8V3_THET4|nr:uncharacterized protein MYCTH_2057586 [Thermothelomyces thermophilus ATCC 42464]AEO56298.1 hypothetical protein MYCTH_2057586 [Thermothelomyces thermophilus ATCC 42464]
MPCLRGVELSLTTIPSNEPIPEYPHPEGTSARLLGTLLSGQNGQASQRKTGPTVAVYIPINTAPSTPCKYVFFRLYMNGRPIAAWGIDPVVRLKGKVTKSLWVPSELYHGQVGFEGRNFVFLPGQEHKSVAEDGGLIEIQVFRARERRARAPRLEEFRHRESYGIARSFRSDNTDEAVFHERSRGVTVLGNLESAGYHLKSPPELFPVISSNAKVPQPSKALRDAYLESYLQRPLPQLPSEEPNRRSRRSSAASATSATSATPSITPSLLRDLEEDSLDLEEVDIGIARVVQLAPSESATDLVGDENSGSVNYSVSDYETSPKSQGDSFPVEERMSPGRYLPTTGSGLDRGIALFTPPKRTVISSEPKNEESLPGCFASHHHLPCFETAALGELERRGARRSPNRAGHVDVAARPESSPQAGKGHGKSLFAGLRRKKSIGSPSKLGLSRPGNGGSIVQRATGSRIWPCPGPDD